MAHTDITAPYVASKMAQSAFLAKRLYLPLYPKSKISIKISY